MDIVFSWLGNNLLPLVLIALGGLYLRKISNIDRSFSSINDNVAAISGKMGIFEVKMENTNKHIEDIVKKIDKIEQHSEAIVLLKDGQSRLETSCKEVQQRLREVEYGKTKNSNGR